MKQTAQARTIVVHPGTLFWFGYHQNQLVFAFSAAHAKKYLAELKQRGWRVRLVSSTPDQLTA